MTIVIILIGTILFMGALCACLAALVSFEDKPDVKHHVELLPDLTNSKPAVLVREMVSEVEATFQPIVHPQPIATPPAPESLMSEVAV